MSKEKLSLEDFLKQFVAYQNKYDAMEYVLAFKGHEHTPVLHIYFRDCADVINDDMKRAWLKRIALEKWERVDGNDVNAFYKSAGTDLYDFFMTSNRKDCLKMDESDTNDDEKQPND